MNFSDVSIRRPVFAAVISLLIATFGIISFERLPLRELPNIDPPVISVTTTYSGASASVIETRVTKPIEDAIAGIESIDTIESQSRDGVSTITITFRLSRDIEAAANDVRNAVARTLSLLPREIDQPQVQKTAADAAPIMFLNMSSSKMPLIELSDYAKRYIVDRLSTIDGVAQVSIFGDVKSLHIRLDRVALAARNLTVADVENALNAENVELPAGRLESTERNLTIRVQRGYGTDTDFRNLVVSHTADGHLVRLGEVAEVKIDALERRNAYRGNGTRQVGIGIVRQSTANQIAVARDVRAEIDKIRVGLPAGMTLVIAVDYTTFIEQSVSEVYATLAITGGLVLLVIYLFLGNLRAAIVPAVTVPVCLLGAVGLLLLFGASLNLLTLLALVLAIGLVVDDSIVVLENVQRRVDLGEPPLVAAVRGTRQVAFAVLATTAVLIAVFVPIVFLQGTIGRLFSELGIALGSAVAISALVALSLSAMMCSRLLRPVRHEGLVSRSIQGMTTTLAALYRAMLEASLAAPALVIMMFVAVVVIAGVLFRLVPGEIAPIEDRGIFDVLVSMPEGMGFDANLAQMLNIEQKLLPLVQQKTATRVVIRTPGSFTATADFNSGRAVVVLAPWGTRPPQDKVIKDVTAIVRQFPAVRAAAIARSSFGRGGGAQTPVQFVLGGASFDELVGWRDKLLRKVEAFPGLLNVDSDYKETKPQLDVKIDPSRAAELGVSIVNIGHTLETMLGQRKVGTFIDRGEEYDVIVEGRDADRRQLSDLTNIMVRPDKPGATLIPLSNLLSVRESATASSLNRFNRLRSITISANLAPGTTLGQGLDFLEHTARSELPATAQISYKGQSLEYKQSSSSLAFTFAFALIVVFLVLAAQFESFIHPLVIILTVPLAVAGALFGLWSTGATLNIYSEIGIVMLVGLAAKNGILIVEFANQLRDEGHDVHTALVEASVTRFRPIIMTSIATAMGTVPLMIWQGAGAQSRFAIGIVVFAGVIFSTGLTLFVVPAFYNLLSRFTRSPGAIAAEIEAWERNEVGRRAVDAPTGT